MRTKDRSIKIISDMEKDFSDEIFIRLYSTTKYIQQKKK